MRSAGDDGASKGRRGETTAAKNTAAKNTAAKNTASRLDALLTDWSTQGLTPPEEAEARELLGAGSADELLSFDEVGSFELAAAALHLTSPAVKVPMPTVIENKIRRAARRRFPERGPESLRADDNLRRSIPREGRSASASTRDFGRSLGWLAAAACLAAAVIGWWPRLQGPDAPVVAETPGSLERSLEDRVAAAADVLRLPWTLTEDPTVSPSASGEVLWSTELQAGFMRFAGLKVNDPSVFQYQLWIFDQEQDERFPVDGGVFDLPPEREAVIPIQAKLAIAGPTLFAVTVEKPGGVVVSDRERIVVLAQAG